MKKSFHFILVLILGLISMQNAIYAQGFMADAVNPGRVYREMKPTDVGGSPLLFENWANARVKIVNGKLITGLQVNFDVYGHKALYLNSNETFEFGDELDYIEVGYDGSAPRKIFKNGFISNQFNVKTFVEVLNDGRYRLLKYTRKVLVDKATYGKAAENKELEEQVFYFIANNTVATQVKLAKSSLEEYADKHWSTLSKFIETNSLNLKKEADFIKAVSVLNTIGH